MGNINYHFLRSVGQAKAGPPQLSKPMPDINGEIRRDGRGYKFQYQPSDHRTFTHPTGVRNLKDYSESELLYTVNELGFRGASFNKQDNALMSAGCSHTYGIGQRDYETWGSKTASKTDLVNWNIGVGGIGADVVAMLIRQFFEEGYIPKVLCVLWPPHERTLLRLDSTMAGRQPLSSKSVVNNVPFESGDFKQEIQDQNVWQFMPGQDLNGLCLNTYDVGGIKTATKSHLLRSGKQLLNDFWLVRQSVIDLCKIHNVQLVEMCSTFDSRDYINERCTQNVLSSPLVLGAGKVNAGVEEGYTWDLARDGLHFGNKSCEYLAKEFARYINFDQL